MGFLSIFGKSLKSLCNSRYKSFFVIRPREKSSQGGRSILEILAVIALFCVLTIGSVFLYKGVVIRQEADSIYEDIMMTASSIRTKGAGRKNTGSGIADTKLIDDKTRTGKEISVSTSCPMHAFTVKVNNVKKITCEQLLSKVWKDRRSPVR